MSESKLPWYKDGLKFKCTQCGKCCTGSSGFVWVSESEVAGMAAALKMDVSLFKRKFIRTRNQKLALVEKKNGDNFDCVFLKDNKCQVYMARPVQCRTYPWWPENLTSEESWMMAAMECEGISDEGTLVPLEEIQERLKADS